MLHKLGQMVARVRDEDSNVAVRNKPFGTVHLTCTAYPIICECSQVEPPFDIARALSDSQAPAPDVPQPRFLDAGSSEAGKGHQHGGTQKSRKPKGLFHRKHDLTGHKGAVLTVKFSECGSLLASGSFDKSVRVWDMEGRREVMCLTEHSNSLSELSWAQDSTRWVQASAMQTAAT